MRFCFMLVQCYHHVFIFKTTHAILNFTNHINISINIETFIFQNSEIVFSFKFKINYWFSKNKIEF